MLSKPTPESIQASFDEIQRFAPSTPLFKWAEIEDIEPIEIKWPKPITPDPMPDDGIETIGSMRLKWCYEFRKTNKNKPAFIFTTLMTNGIVSTFDTLNKMGCIHLI